MPRGLPRRDHRPMRSLARRSLLPVLVLALVAGLAPAGAVAAEDTVSTGAVTAAERGVLDLTNARRTAAGRIKLRADARLFALARERAEYMAATDTFSHTQSGGVSVFDLMTQEGIKWYGGGEIIAWNTAAALDYSAAFAVKAWMESPGHRAILLSSGYNYVGFGLAISPTTGKRYWAGVYLKGPDRTGAWAKIRSVSKTNLSSRYARVTIRWTGNDTRLQVLTAGFRYYQIQKRRDGGAWYTYGLTTATSLSRKWSRGHVYEFRVRARDKAGNWGSWRNVIIRP
jgi:uncharacterized protein YkwD